MIVICDESILHNICHMRDFTMFGIIKTTDNIFFLLIFFFIQGFIFCWSLIIR